MDGKQVNGEIRWVAQWCVQINNGREVVGNQMILTAGANHKSLQKAA